MQDKWIEISGVRTATPKNVYTQQGAKPAEANADSHRWLCVLCNVQACLAGTSQPRVAFHSGALRILFILYITAHNTYLPSLIFYRSPLIFHHYTPLIFFIPRHLFASPILHTKSSCITYLTPLIPSGTATPNTVYSSKAPNPHAWKTSTQNFRIFYWQGSPTTFTHSKLLHTAKPFLEAPQKCTCRTDSSRGPRQPRAATFSRGSKYCDRSRGPRRPGASGRVDGLRA